MLERAVARVCLLVALVVHTWAGAAETTLGGHCVPPLAPDVSELSVLSLADNNGTAASELSALAPSSLKPPANYQQVQSLNLPAVPWVLLIVFLGLFCVSAVRYFGRRLAVVSSIAGSFPSATGLSPNRHLSIQEGGYLPVFSIDLGKSSARPVDLPYYLRVVHPRADNFAQAPACLGRDYAGPLPLCIASEVDHSVCNSVVCVFELWPRGPPICHLVNGLQPSQC